MSNKRMADVFRLPLQVRRDESAEYDVCYLTDPNGWKDIYFSGTRDKAEAVCKAVNMHDTLVDTLREAYYETGTIFTTMFQFIRALERTDIGVISCASSEVLEIFNEATSKTVKMFEKIGAVLSMVEKMDNVSVDNTGDAKDENND